MEGGGSACMPAWLSSETRHPGGLAKELDCVHAKEAWPEARGAIFNLGSQ